MQKAVLYGIIAAVVVAAGVGISFAAMSLMNNNIPPTEAANLQANSMEPRIIKHSMGETEIVGTPRRIVALDWSASEILLAMDLQPIAVTGLEDMKKRLKPEGLSPDIVDVGQGLEPNLERILELEPDLIIAEKWAQSALYNELSEIAPTVMYDNSPPLDGIPTHLDALEQNIVLVADAVNKRDKGDEIVDKLHAKYDEAAEKIEAAGLKGTKYVVGAVDPPYGDYTAPTLRFFDNTFFMSEILSKIGLENAVTEEYGLANWGMKQVGLEGLATVDGPDVHFFYIHTEGQDAFNNEWKDNPVWANLEIAKNENRHPLGTLYVYGGPKQMGEMVDKVMEALTPSNEVRVISHAMGRTEITGTPQRIVALEFNYAEDLLVLGVQPVGVADIEMMNEWVNLKEYSLDKSAVEVGVRAEPNLEVIAQLEPDLIIGHVTSHGHLYEKLSQIAPTLIFNPDPAEEENLGQFEEMQQTFMTIADVVGRHAQGVAILESLDEKIKQASQKVAESGNAEKGFVLAMGYTWEDATYIRLYTNNAFAVEIMESMGMDNAWDIDYASWGYSDAGLEDLTTVDDANFFYIAQKGDDVFATTYQDNPVWNNLKFVQEGRVYPLGGDTAPFGGPVSAEVIVEKVVATVTG